MSSSWSGASWFRKAAPEIDDSIHRLMDAANAQDAELILIVPPFASPDRPSLGVHVVAAAASASGVQTSIIYANLAFARVIGPEFYRSLCHTPTEELVGERIFRAARYSVPSGGDAPPPCWQGLGGGETPEFGAVQEIAAKFVLALVREVAILPARYVGLSTVFEQTLASLSIIAELKRQQPTKIALLGGANADGVMAEALAAREPAVDYIFTGEAEDTVVKFLARHKENAADIPRIVPGKMAAEMDRLPPPCFDAFFDQYMATVHESVCSKGLNLGQIRLPYESSRGCWWGEKHHCTFCGLNANGMAYRSKSPSKVADEITALSNAHGIDRILMVDNIMPHGYFTTLLPRLQAAEKRLSLFYEQKANISLERMTSLKAAGVDSIQPGIESLSTALLKRMRKGSTAQINIDCMRFARSNSIAIAWNLLCDFPEDEESDYESTLALIPLLHHLQPPGGVGGLSIDRFSPYHSDPDAFAISAITPLESYSLVFPDGDLKNLAYHFQGAYTSAIRRNPALHLKLEGLVKEWDSAWKESHEPLLSLFDLEDGQYLVIDTRACSHANARCVKSQEAYILLHGSSAMSPEVKEALDRGQMAEIDGRYGAIACAPIETPAWATRQRPTSGPAAGFGG